MNFLLYFAFLNEVLGSAGLEDFAFSSISTSGNVFSVMREINDLHHLMREEALESRFDDAQGMHPLELALGNSLLNMWLDKRQFSDYSSEYEERLVAYAASCSRHLIDSLFRDFELDFADRISQEDCKKIVYRANSLSSEIAGLREEIQQEILQTAWKESKYEERRAIYQPLIDRFGPAFVFLKRRLGCSWQRERHQLTIPFKFLDLKREEFRVLAGNLRDCEADEIEIHSQKLIDFVETLQEEEGFTCADTLFACGETFTLIIDHSLPRARMNKAKKSLETAQNSLSEHIEQLQTLEDEFALLESFFPSNTQFQCF